MANPDRGYDDYDSPPGWVIIIFIIIIVLGIIFALTDKDAANKCTTYYQGDELVEDCP